MKKRTKIIAFSAVTAVVLTLGALLLITILDQPEYPNHNLKLLYSENSNTAIYSDCNFSYRSPLKFECATQLNPPLHTIERNLNWSITYEMRNDNSFFYSSSDGNGTISILQQYGYDPMFSVHVTTLRSDIGPTFVVNKNSLEICERNPIQTYNQKSVYAYVYDQLYVEMEGNIIAELGAYHCKTLRIGEGVAAFIKYNNDRYIEIIDLKTNPPLKRGWMNLESNAFEMCLDNRFVVVGYHQLLIYEYYAPMNKYLYYGQIILDRSHVFTGCQIFNGDLYITLDSGSSAVVIGYHLDNVRSHYLVSFWETRLFYEGQYRNSISELSLQHFNDTDYLSISTWGGGNNHTVSEYPQFYVYALPDRKYFFNFTTDGSMFFTSSTVDSNLYFLLGGQKGHADYPSEGGSMYLFELEY